ncbi:MAG: sugar ABC transporter permease [Christensenellaceae bacterium]|jgi:multiple sugar transport system permease protein|nr:sugar ABC transporter permease [Christensenellaceae bacterium]
MKKEEASEKLIDRSALSYKALTTVKKNWGGWLIMLPGIILFAFFVWIPLITNIKLSFQETVGFTGSGFVGFDNYIRVMDNPIFWKALTNTFKYAFWSVIIGFLVPIVLGLFLSEVVHFKGLFRVGIYFPAIISGIAVVIMWTYIFNPNPGAVMNVLLGVFGIAPSSFLSSQEMVIPLIVITMTWKGAGATALIYLSALQNIGDAQYEAARIDGANALQRIRYVTLPHIWPTVKMLFILQIISIFQIFYEPLVMTGGGGPNGASVSLLLLSYQYAFEMGDASASAAVGVILSLIIIVLTVVYLKPKGITNFLGKIKNGIVKAVKKCK